MGKGQLIPLAEFIGFDQNAFNQQDPISISTTSKPWP